MASKTRFKVGLVIPRSGSAGIYGPSCKTCAELAAEELNDAGGIDGRHIALTVVDGAQAPAQVAASVRSIVEKSGIDGFVGMHDSGVRKALLEQIGGRIPYVYTALYEGEDRSPSLVSTGLTTSQQAPLSLKWLKDHRNVSRWFFIGNDYVWPQQVCRDVGAMAKSIGAAVVQSQFVPLGCQDYSACLTAIAEARPDAVFVALVGADSVEFNRQFSKAKLDRSIIRFIPLLEENTLLAVGPEALRSVYTASTYFADVDTADNGAFRAAYEAKFGAGAPQLNALGVSCYEGLYVLKALFAGSAGLTPSQMVAAAEGLEFRSMNGSARISGGHAVRDVLLAETKGASFKVRAHFDNVPPALALFHS